MLLPTKTVIFDKLFGGPLHGKRLSLNERSATQIFPAFDGIAQYRNYGSSIDQYTSISWNEEIYTRRFAKISNITVIYFAYSACSDERAFEMLANYMLRGSRTI